MTLEQLARLQQMQPSQGASPMQPYYDINNPYSPKSMEMVNSIAGVTPQPKGFLPSLLHHAGGLLSDIGINGLRNSPRTQHLGRNMQMSGERQAAENARVQEIMRFLQQSGESRELMQHKIREQEETERHHRTQEGMMAPHYAATSQKMMRELEGEEETDKLQTKYPGAVSYKGMTANEKSAASKELRERANMPSKQLPVLNTLNKIYEIAEKHPDLSTSIAAAMFPEKYKGGVMDTIKLKFMKKEKREALEKLNKYSNDLILKKVHGLGSQRASIFLEKIMQSANPHYGLTPEAIKTILDNYKEEYDATLADSKIARDGLSKRFYAPQYMAPQEMATPSAEAPTGVNDISQEDLEYTAQKYGITIPELLKKLGK